MKKSGIFMVGISSLPKSVAPMLVLLLLVLPLATLCTVRTTYASSSEPSIEAVAGVYLVNLQKFELSSGSYDVDFYMWFSWYGNKTINYEFMNGRASSIDIIEKRDGFLDLRVRGTFLKSPNFRDYPFDKHRLTVEIEDKSLTLEDLVFVPDKEESGIDHEINIAGWSIEGWKIESVEHAYPGNLTYSRLVFTFTIGRSTLSSILKSVVPISIITCIAMLAFFVSPSNYGQRISLGVTTLMAAVANHLALTSQIPPIGYLTIADKIMITAYAMFLYSLMVSVMGMRLVDQKKTESAIKLNRKAGILVPIVAGTILSILVLFT
jgi:hypothetical protein